MNFHSTTNRYTHDHYALILQVEEGGNPHLSPYNDGKGWVTIGVGFNLADANVRNQVFAKLGITNALLINDLTSYLERKHKGESDTKIQGDLGKIMNQYSPSAAFNFTDEN